MKKQTYIPHQKAKASFLSRFPKPKEYSFYAQKWVGLVSKRILGFNAFAVLATSLILPSPVFTRENEEVNPFENRTVTIEAESFLPEKASVRFPTLTTAITQNYHLFHPALDIDGSTGDPIYAIAKGVVVVVEKSRFAYGNAVYIDHGDNYTSLYAHLSEVKVVEGQFVDIDTEIGLMGSTGHSTGAHLHLEVRQNSLPINPWSVLPKN